MREGEQGWLRQGKSRVREEVLRTGVQWWSRGSTVRIVVERVEEGNWVTIMITRRGDLDCMVKAMVGLRERWEKKGHWT